MITIYEEVTNEPVEIIGETNYDNSHKFILHSPIFNDYDYVNKLRRIIPEYRIETSGNYDEIVVYADKDELKYIQRAVNKFNSRYCQHGMYNQEVNEAVEIEVENPGVLEVPEGKNVEDLPIKHFVALANKKGLATVTKALNNLQVWNKNKNKSLSKWAGDMIDKVTKRVENQKKESLIREFSSNFDGTEFGEVEFYSDDLYKWKDEDSIISAIEAHSPIDINVYGVEFEPSHNLVITYEVRTEDYDEDRIEAIVIDSLEKLEDRIRGAKPKYLEQALQEDAEDEYSFDNLDVDAKKAFKKGNYKVPDVIYELLRSWFGKNEIYKIIMANLDILDLDTLDDESYIKDEINRINRLF